MFRKLWIAAFALLIALGCALPVFAEPQVPAPIQIALEPAVTNGIAGHRATATAQAEGVTKFKWKSSAPKIASVSESGAIQFKKPGVVTISVTAKGAIKAAGAITLTVLANEHAVETSRVYLKGNFVYADILCKNETLSPIKKMGKTPILLTGLAGYERFDAKKGIAKKAIKPSESGFVTFKLMKVNKAAVDLTQAVAAIAPTV